MSIKIEAPANMLNPTVHKKGTFNNPETGEQIHYDFHEQILYRHIDGMPYPEKFVIRLEKGVAAYAPGFYTLDMSSLVTDRGKLTVAREPKLLPVAAQEVQASRKSAL